MADNVAITAGAGTSIRTDDNAGQHHQAVKITLGADGTFREFADGDQRDSAGYAVWVDPRPKSASQTQNQSGLTTATTAYTSGDVLGSLLTFTSMARASGGRGRITGAVLLDDGDIISGVDLFLFSATVTFGTDNAAPSISDADAANCVGIIQLPAAIDVGASRIASAHSIAVPYACAATSLFVAMVTRSDHTFFAAADDLHLTLFYELD